MKITLHYFLILTFFIFHSTVVANIHLPKLISDGMILQRDAKVIVWGWADAAEKVVVEIDNKTYSTIANADGLWKISLKPHKAGGPFTMVLKGNNQLQINNILFGDVWLCSGQSNMELPMRRVKLLYEKEIATATNPEIRIFTVPQKYNFKAPGSDFAGGNWQEVNPKTIQDFSAVAYFFATELYEKYKMPVGLINASLGGSPIQAWMSEEALASFPDYLNEAKKFRDDELINDIETADRKKSNEWYALATQTDKGQTQDWKNPMVDDTDWTTTVLPGYWSDTDIGNVNGVVWFRKEFNITKENAGKSVF
jgi:sialate O-acetylesterase